MAEYQDVWLLPIGVKERDALEAAAYTLSKLADLTKNEDVAKQSSALYNMHRNTTYAEGPMRVAKEEA